MPQVCFIYASVYPLIGSTDPTTTAPSVPVKRTLSNNADETPVSSLSFKQYLTDTAPKQLKPISQLRVPPLPPEVRARMAAEEKARLRQEARKVSASSTKKIQATLDPALLAASRRPDSGGSSAGFKPTSTLTLKNQAPGTTSKAVASKPTSTTKSEKSKSKPASSSKSASSSFDWTAWRTHR